MKKLILLVFGFLSLTSLSFSQENIQKDVLTSGKWKVESIQIGEETQDYSESNSWMVFSADGQYKIVMDHGEKQGNWKLGSKNKIIKLGEGNLGDGLAIKLLNNKELLFSATEGDIVYTMKLRK